MIATVALRDLFVGERYALALALTCKPSERRHGALHALIGPASVARSLFGKHSELRQTIAHALPLRDQGRLLLQQCCSVVND